MTSLLVLKIFMLGLAFYYLIDLHFKNKVQYRKDNPLDLGLEKRTNLGLIILVILFTISVLYLFIDIFFNN